jgi:hypothetical protein
LSGGGAYKDEMGYLSRLSDQELDRLLAGKEPPEGEDFGELAAFVSDAAAVLHETPDEATAARHLAAIVAAAQLQLEHESSAPRPSVNPSGLNRKALYFRGRRKLMSSSPPSSFAGKIALVAVIVLAAFGGSAYAGVLPDPVQGAVADVADTVGVSLPGAENDSDDGAVEDVDNGAVGDTDVGTVGDTNGGDQGADEDDLGDNDQGDQGADEADQGDQGDNDQGDQGSVDEGDQGDNDQGADEGDQGNADEGDQGGNEGGGASGEQGDGDN